MLKIGITGGIASGKSTVSTYIREKGYSVIDSDEGARIVVEPGGVGLKKICEKLGVNFLKRNGELDRMKMADYIFSDASNRKKFEAIIHPMIFEWIDQQLETLDVRVVFIDMPLLYEVGYQAFLDEVWLVYATPDQQLERMITRNAYSKEEALARLNAQWPIEEKKRLATVVIDNQEDLVHLYQQIDRLLLLV